MKRLAKNVEPRIPSFAKADSKFYDGLMHTLDWSISGSDGEVILGSTHLPPVQVQPRGVLLICHGSKGYKDYGIVPGIAHYAAMQGFIAHRFNFSHSGMTNRLDTFERPDLFEKDTWGRQIVDLRAVANAAHEGELPAFTKSKNLPQIWYGHSRGGVTVLLTAARAFMPTRYPKLGAMPLPVGVIPCASPHRAFWLHESDKETIYAQGYLDSPSQRTKQMLRIGLPWLKEIEHDPDAFDPVIAASRVSCPMEVIHGTADMTVGVDSAEKIAGAAPRATLHIIEGATHVFNTSNPMRLEREPSVQGRALINRVNAFCDQVVAL